MGNRCLTLGDGENVCSIGSCVSSAERLPELDDSVSASFLLHTNARYLSVPVFTVVAKLALPSDQFQQHVAQDYLDSVRYEYVIYKNVITPLIEERVCPFFIKTYGSAYNCELSHIQNMLKTEALPSLFEQSAEKFQFLLLEHFPVESVLPFPINSDAMPWTALFQVATACYALQCSKLAHNQLLTKHVLSVRRPVNQVHIMVENVAYSLTTNYKMVLTNFENAYCERLGKTMAHDVLGFNTFVALKDWVTFVKDAYSQCDTPSLQQEYLNLLSDDPAIQTRVKQSWDARVGSVEDKSWYEQFDPLLRTIKKIAVQGNIPVVDPLSSSLSFVVNSSMFRSTGTLNRPTATSVVNKDYKLNDVTLQLNAEREKAKASSRRYGFF